MARSAVVLAVAAALLAGCGKDSATPEDEVRAAVEGYAKAFAERDYQALCDTYLDPKVIASLERSGLPCESALRPQVSATRNPKLAITSVKIDGKVARVVVHATADGEPPTDQTLALVETKDGWRLTPLGVTGPAPVAP